MVKAFCGVSFAPLPVNIHHNGHVRLCLLSVFSSLFAILFHTDYFCWYFELDIDIIGVSYTFSAHVYTTHFFHSHCFHPLSVFVLPSAKADALSDLRFDLVHPQSIIIFGFPAAGSDASLFLRPLILQLFKRIDIHFLQRIPFVSESVCMPSIYRIFLYTAPQAIPVPYPEKYSGHHKKNNFQSQIIGFLARAADIRYFAGLEIVFLVVSAVFCGIRYWYRLRTVKRQIRDYMQGMQTLSDTEDALEEVYMDALEQLQNKRQEEKGAYRNQQREMEEYYALWVHQIKTPISAMRLLLQREEQKQTEDETVGMEKSVLYDMQQELFWINQYINMALQYQRMNSGMNDLAKR